MMRPFNPGTSALAPFFALLALGIAGFSFSATAAEPAQWLPRGPGGGGAFFAPSFSPFARGEIYAASDMTEVFHTTNFGEAWSVVDFRQIQGGRQAILQFTSDPNVRYALSYGNDATTPVRSVDAGVHWTALANDPTEGGAFALFADPDSTNRLVLSDYSNLYFSNDGGNSFQTVYSVGQGLYVAGAFFDGASIYVGTEFGLVVSTNDGSSFALANLGGFDTNNEVIFSFAAAKQNGVTRFFATTMHPADVFPGAHD